MDAQASRGQTEEEREYYSLSERVYEKFAHFYDLIVFPFRRLRSDAADLVEVSADDKVLDVATGTGEQALAFAAKGAEVVGIDLSEQMLRVARRKDRFSRLSFRHADATDLPFADGNFDLVCISFALHEMPDSVRTRVLRDMARVAKDGGRVVVVDYSLPAGRLARALSYRFVKLYERDHYADFVRRDVPSLLAAAGFRARESHSKLGGNATIWIGVKPKTASVACATSNDKNASSGEAHEAPARRPAKT